MIAQDTAYDLALAMAFSYTPATALDLWRMAGGGRAVWENRHDLSAVVPQASKNLLAMADKIEAALPLAEKELEKAQDMRIKCLTMGDSAYPLRLKECNDAPLVLFYIGNADLNCRHVISMVGTRHCTEYGKDICRIVTRDLARLVPGTLVVSGLAYGIDINAHRGALEASLPTVGVLAHGLDSIYPSTHRETARRMAVAGGLLTEFPTATKLKPVNFVRRNRIIAGVCDAVVVVESAEKGGSLITASIADSYNRDVCAFPGRVGDEYSAGCNKLIAENKAQLVTSAEDIVKALGWDGESAGKDASEAEPTLFPELNEVEQKVYDALDGSDGKQINLLTVETNISVGELMSVLFEMEMRGIVKSLGGARYRLTLQ